MAAIRSATAIDQEASTRKRIRLETFFTRTFFWKSMGWIAKATFLRCSCLRFWNGAAARRVASKARSSVAPFEGLAWIYRPRFRLVCVCDRLPECLLVSLSSGVSNFLGSKVSPTFTFCPPSHQWASCLSKTACCPGSATG